LQKATIHFGITVCMYISMYASMYARPPVRLVCESVHMEQLGSQWKDFQEI